MKKRQLLNIALILLMVVSLFSHSACSQISAMNRESKKSEEELVVFGSDSSKKETNVSRAVDEVKTLFVTRYKTAKEIDLVSMFSAIGSVSGFGYQMAIRKALVEARHLPVEQAFVVMGGADGKNYYFGDQLNQPLLEAPMSVRGLILGGAKYAGSKNLPDAIEIIKYNASTVGKSEFGIPRLPKEYWPKELPIVALQKNWNDTYAIMSKHQVDPLFLGWIPALAAQKLMVENKNKLEPGLAAKIVLESAFPMSKVDPVPILGHDVNH